MQEGMVTDEDSVINFGALRDKLEQSYTCADNEYLEGQLSSVRVDAMGSSLSSCGGGPWRHVKMARKQPLSSSSCT